MSPTTDPMSGGTTNNDPTVNPDGTETYNGVTFNPADPTSFALGTVAGLQYNNNTYGKCFYVMVDTVNFLSYF